MEAATDGSLELYEGQLRAVEAAIANCSAESERQELCVLRDNLRELVTLIGGEASNGSSSNDLDDEYALFMKEVVAETASAQDTPLSSEELERINGMKCQAPHKQLWGDMGYHNAVVCSVVDPQQSKDKLEVRVVFTNPIHKEMLPCPYLLDSECKFSAEKCRFSHGETVLYSSLKEYIEPNFAALSVRSQVLAKKTDNLWDRAVVKRILNGSKCLVRFQSNKKDLEVDLEHIFPLLDGTEGAEDEGSEGSDVEEQQEDVRPLLRPCDTFGEWEQYTKGMGSKMMQMMGYVHGTGLGPNADGRIDPVPAFVLPSGKSLDYCMNLREKAGGDKDLFSVERKLKRQQKKEETRNRQIYENEQKKVDVFSILNQTLEKPKVAEDISAYKSRHRKEMKGETSRGLNVAELKITEDIKKVQRDIAGIQQSLSRHSDVGSHMNKVLRVKLQGKESELHRLKVQSSNISCEQKLRSDSKKMTIF